MAQVENVVGTQLEFELSLSWTKLKLLGMSSRRCSRVMISLETWFWIELSETWKSLIFFGFCLVSLYLYLKCRLCFFASSTPWLNQTVLKKKRNLGVVQPKKKIEKRISGVNCIDYVHKCYKYVPRHTGYKKLNKRNKNQEINKTKLG